MTDRAPVMLALIALLVAISVVLNLDLVRPGYQAPLALRRLANWQGAEETRLQLRRGLDLQGGVQALLEVDREVSRSFTSTDLENAKTVIQSRVDILGVTEAVVQTQGEDKIVVELPGVDDPAQAMRTIGSTALLEFIYGGPEVTSDLAAGSEVVTTEPTLFDELPEDKRDPRLYSPEDLEAIRGLSDATDDADGADSADGTATTAAAGATTVSTRESATTAAPSGATGSPASLSETATATASSALTSTTGSAVTSTGETTDTFATRVFPTVVTGRYITRASANINPTLPGQYLVSFSLNAEGAQRMQRFTSQHLEEVMAIALDKKIISAPVVQQTIASDGQISGDFTKSEAESLAVQLQSGSLPVALRAVGQKTIGPTLGRSAVRQSVLGGAVGMLAVMLFMLLYYRVPGVLANLALTIYALLTLTLFRLIPVTLTLAGIAGFVLSIGMAVDANILIFERMKEELRAGRTLRAATEIGFRRAWPSIRDSNLSTLITCAILFWFGSQFGASIVKGFAVTLSLGVLTSMFTAITVTRTFLQVAHRVVAADRTEGAPIDSPRLRLLFGF